jgi:diguanylate cyclase (GGDEF)-like protein
MPNSISDVTEAPVERSSRVERFLADLDEASEFVTGSVNTSDVFNFIADRLGRSLMFASCELLLLDKDRERLEVRYAFGDNCKGLGSRVGLDEGPAGECFSKGEVQWSGLITVVPLKNGNQVFGVLRLTFRGVVSWDRAVLEAIGERVSPMVLHSLSMERSRANALTDATTDLPNERAFYLILESQVAEAQRDQRPLSILAIDIEDFSDHNRRLGHPAGDSILNFTARTIKDSLRQMDFFARSKGDEFLIVLPTATTQTADEIVRRIGSAFSSRSLRLTEELSLKLELYFGSASFGPDGETPAQLLTAARIRKTEAKDRGDGKVVFFPRNTAS